MTPRKLALLATVAAVLFTAAAIAQPGPGFRPGGPGGLEEGPGAGDRHLHLLPPPGYLQLTEEQRGDVQPILEALREDLGALREAQHALREQLRDELGAEEPDVVAVGQLTVELHALRGESREALQAAEGQFVRVLTPEQLQKYENFKELRRLFQHRDPGGGPRPDGPDA